MKIRSFPDDSVSGDHILQPEQGARCIHQGLRQWETQAPRGARPNFFYFFLVAGRVRNAPERSWHAAGPLFRPNSRFWNQFGSFLMIWARIDILGGLGPPSQSLAWCLSSTSQPWRPRQRPTWLKRSNLACGGCDSSRLEGGVWRGEAHPGKSLNFL